MVLDLVDKFNLDYLFNKGKLRFLVETKICIFRQIHEE